MVVAAVDDVGVGVDVMAPFSLSFLLLSDCDGILTMDGCRPASSSFCVFFVLPFPRSTPAPPAPPAARRHSTRLRLFLAVIVVSASEILRFDRSPCCQSVLC